MNLWYGEGCDDDDIYDLMKTIALKITKFKSNHHVKFPKKVQKLR